MSFYIYDFCDFSFLCWITFVTILGCLCPIGHSLDIPTGWGSWTTAVSCGPICLESHLRRNARLWPEIKGHIPTSRMAFQGPHITGSMVTQRPSGHTLRVDPFLQALKRRMPAIYTPHLYPKQWGEGMAPDWELAYFPGFQPHLPSSHGKGASSSSLGFLINERIHYQAQSISRRSESILKLSA